MTAPPVGDRVGYGRPPRETRWRRGQSGNPRHRKHKRPESTVAKLDKLLLAPVKITLNGEAIKVPALEAIICQLVQQAISGDERAHRVLLRYQEFAVRNSEKTLELTFVKSDYTRAFAAGLSDNDDE